MAIDQRFYAHKKKLKLSDLASLCGAELRGGGGEHSVTGLGASDTASKGDLCFFTGKAKNAGSVSSQALACFIDEKAAAFLPEGLTALITDTPRQAHSKAGLEMFAIRDWQEAGTPEIDPGAYIAPGAFIGAGAKIGANTRIGPSCVIGPGVEIGSDCEIGPNVTVRCALIGKRVKIHSGAVIGEAGFGVDGGASGTYEVPQWGRVILHDDVSIGANSCVDRGALGDTIIGARTKLDNLCQIAHNCVIGSDCIFASFAGISGSTKIGNGCVFGGSAATAGHISICDGVTLAAATGVMRDITVPGVYGGLPEQPFRSWMREVAWLRKAVNSGRK